MQQTNNTQIPDKIFQRMSNEEQYHYACLSLNGFKQGDTILMGVEAYTMVEKYVEEMKLKYELLETPIRITQFSNRNKHRTNFTPPKKKRKSRSKNRK